MHFYRIVQFHIRRRFRASLSVRVSNLGPPVTYAIKCCTNKPGRKIYRCMPTGSTQHYTLLNNPNILHTKTFFEPACHPSKKISSETKLSHYSLLHPHALQASSSTYKYSSNIYSIKLDHSPLGRNINKSIQPKQVDSNTNFSQNISLFPSL